MALLTLLALLACITPTAVQALEEDRLQEIVIQARSAALDEQTGVITYEGRVTLTQGSLSLSAEVLRATRQDGQVVEIAASQGDSGEPVSYTQLISPDEPEVSAVAREMIYDLRAQTIELNGDAELRQVDIRFSGSSILYDISRGRTKGDGGVEMVFPGQFLDALDQDEDQSRSSEAP